MKIKLEQLRRLVREEVSRSVSEADGTSVGKELKGTAAAERASEKLESNPALQKLMDGITTADGLASFLQDVLGHVSRKGIDRSEIQAALKKVASAVAGASTGEKKE